MQNDAKVDNLLSKPPERKSGIAIWRQIADSLRQQIAAGRFSNDDRLPAEFALAQEFGVNRHTVRAALQALGNEGVLESRQGQGTFIKRRRRLTYPIARRTRFSEGLASQSRATRALLLEHAIEPANIDVAGALDLTPGAAVIRLETLSEADDMALSCSTSWFSDARFSGIQHSLENTGSYTKALALHGVDDYTRTSTKIEAQHAAGDDLRHMRLSPGAIVLVTLAVNSDSKGQPIQYSRTRFAADRVSLTIENDPV
ncbi:MAG: phosphonate metabolism transcriptional regulator PhnF [Pseudomonadota bacterium]